MPTPAPHQIDGCPSSQAKQSLQAAGSRWTRKRVQWCLFAALCGLMYSHGASATLVSAVLPNSRSAEVGAPVTVFATVLNAGTVTASNCRPALGSALDVSLQYQTTNASTNTPNGTPNTPVDVPANAGQSWLLELTPNAAFAPSVLNIDFICDNQDPPQTLSGVNTLLLSASLTPTADIIALSATTSGNGIVATQVGEAAAFSLASVNVGTGATIRVAPVGLFTVPLETFAICQTNPLTAACLAPPSSFVELFIDSNDTPTFSVFVSSTSELPFIPEGNRVSVTFSESGVVRGSTSVALTITAAPEPLSTPNILLIISDDQGLDASAQYSAAGDPPVTPTLDALAAQGLTFDNVWATPSCTTTRASMLTGLHGVNSGIDSTPGRIDPSTEILQGALGNSTDYSTGVFGKWHVGGGNVEADHPNQLGIDHYAGNLVGNISDYFNWDLTINGVAETTTDYHTSKITDLASGWIAEQTSPWFAWVAYSAPHSPFHLPPDTLQSTGLPGGADIANNRRAYYLAAIEALDTEIGRLLGTLTPAMRENTVVIYIGDNGTPRNVIDDTVFTRSQGKGTLYQGGIAVPMIANGALVTRAGQREDALIASTDVYATITDIAGSNLPATADSVSFKALLGDAGAASRPYNYSEIQGVDNSGWTVRNDTFKLIVFTDGREELYNLANEFDEQTNLLPGTATETATRDELYSVGAMIRGESTDPGSSPIDITDALLNNTSANCADYVASYRADALDVNNNQLFEGSLVISVVDNKCVFSTNLIPNHAFNDGAQGFPNPVAAQSDLYSITTTPTVAPASTALSLSADNALLLNGVKVDLLAAACFGVGDGRVGCNDINQPWRFDPMFPANGFRVDSHNAHTQPNGAYHYHGTPNALFSNTPDAPSPVVGFAADGFPIFGSFFSDGGTVREAQSSYQLRVGDRPDGAGDPGGSFDGTYRDDYEYVPGSGDLDACNGMTVNGVYGYYITQRFPYMLGCFTGTPDSSFNK